MRRLRVAQVAPLWASIPPESYGGTELVVHLLVEELHRMGHQVSLFAAADARTSARLRPVAPRSILGAMEAGEAEEYEHYANGAIVDAILAAGEFDVIHSHLGFPQLPIGALSPVPFLQTMHHLPTVDDLRVLAKYPTVTVSAVSHFAAAALPEERRLRTPVVHHGIDLAQYQPRTEPGEYLAFLGRMGPQKSPLDAIRVARSAGLPLVLAGVPQNAHEARYFEEQVRPLIDGREVVYRGAVGPREKNELLRHASALLFPIQGVEAFGVAMAEAMACGTPVVGWDRASVREVVDYGETGYYGGSVEELGAMVKDALRLDRAAIREKARQRFSGERMARDYVSAYEALIGGAA